MPTDADGRFVLSAMPGAGDLLVEAPGEYIRTKFLRGRNEPQPSSRTVTLH